MQATEA